MSANQKQVVFDVNGDSLAKLADQITAMHSDCVLVIAPFAGSLSVHGPVKKGPYKGYHRIKTEIWIPEDSIKGDEALSDFGAFAVVRLPKSRVECHLLKEERHESVGVD